MKIATVRYKLLGDTIGKSYLIETPEDLVAYQKEEVRRTTSAFNIGLKSNIPLEKFDHIIPYDGPLRGVMVLAWHRARAAQSNPLYELFPAMEDKILGMGRCLNDGRTLLVNPVGGYCPLNDSMHEIVSIEDGFIPTAQKTRIREGSTWLALENDTKLCPEAEQFLFDRDPEPSMICDLRGLDPSSISKGIKAFADGGGIGVVAWTTGLDKRQLFGIADMIVSAGIRRVALHISEHDEELLLELKRYAKKNCIALELIK